MLNSLNYVVFSLRADCMVYRYYLLTPELGLLSALINIKSDVCPAAPQTCTLYQSAIPKPSMSRLFLSIVTKTLIFPKLRT